MYHFWQQLLCGLAQLFSRGPRDFWSGHGAQERGRTPGREGNFSAQDTKGSASQTVCGSSCASKTAAAATVSGLRAGAGDHYHVRRGDCARWPGLRIGWCVAPVPEAKHVSTERCHRFGLRAVVRNTYPCGDYSQRLLDGMGVADGRSRHVEGGCDCFALGHLPWRVHGRDVRQHAGVWHHRQQ